MAKKPSLTSPDVPSDATPVEYVAFAIQKSKEKPYEYILITIEFDKDDNVVSIQRSLPMQFFMAVYSQKRAAAEKWTAL